MPKKPQDHKSGLFEWSTDAGTITLPAITKIKAGTLRKIRNVPDLDAVFILLEDVCDAEQLALVDNLDVGELNDMFAAWQESGDLPQS